MKGAEMENETRELRSIKITEESLPIILGGEYEDERPLFQSKTRLFARMP